jgi:alpha-galactosidase
MKSRLATMLSVPAAALLAAGVAIAVPTPAAAIDNGVARTPPMGWNDWNSFGCNVSETLIKQTADAIVSKGLAAVGYQYVVVDDCWFDPNRDSSGNLQANSSRFPSGMKALGDYLHGKGLKFGIYQVPTQKTCAQGTGAYPGATGSQGHESQDARQFAAWGVDYLKYDWCSGAGSVSDQIAAFAKMRDALAATGRPIVFSINPNSFHCCPGPTRNWGDVSHLWRTTEDISVNWDTGKTNGYPMGIRNIININAPLSGYAGPGHWNDPDMLEVGVGSNLNETQQRSHFAMWAVMAAPLIMGNDLRNASSTTLNILSNKALIDINQDSLGQQGVQISNDGTRRVLAKKLSNGDVAVALFNGGSSATTISTSASAAGLSGSSFQLREVWSGAVTGTSGTISANVPAYGTVVYRVSRTGGTTTTTSTTTTTTTGGGGTTTTTTTTPATTTTTTTNGGGNGGCTASFSAPSTWPGGYVANVNVTANQALSGWRVTITLPSGASVTNGWNATLTGSSGTVTAANVSYNGTVASGQSTSFGFQGNGSPTGTTVTCSPA